MDRYDGSYQSLRLNLNPETVTLVGHSGPHSGAIARTGKTEFMTQLTSELETLEKSFVYPYSVRNFLFHMKKVRQFNMSVGGQEYKELRRKRSSITAF